MIENKTRRRFPMLDTGRLRLRRITMRDATDVFKLFSRELVTRYYDLGTITKPGEAVKIIRHIQRGYRAKRSIRWGITLRNDGRLIGSIGLKFVTPYRAELSYDLRNDHWNRGIASEAAGAVIGHAFTSMDIRRIEAYVMLKNKPSIALLERLRFAREGRLRDLLRKGGRYHDCYLYSLIRNRRNQRP